VTRQSPPAPEAAAPVTLGSPAFRSTATEDFRVTEAQFAPHTVLPAHAHERTIVGVIVAGGFELAIEGRRFPVRNGDCMIEPAGTSHANRLGPSGSRNVILELAPHLAGEWFEASPRFLGEPATVRDGRLARIATLLRHEMQSPDAVSPLAIEALGLELLALAARRTAVEGRSRGRPAWLLRVEERLHATLDAPVSLGVLAGEAGVHRVHLGRTFRAYFGCSIGDYHRQLRIQWAARELAAGDDTLSNIAQRAGFADQSHFTRVFRQWMGTTPQHYRAQRRAR
jgi:AraC family transcriptional regulator